MSAHEIYILLEKKLYFIPPVESLFKTTHTSSRAVSKRVVILERGGTK
jgi:hypothetical protein